MKAVTFDRYGGPEVLRIADLAVPKVGPGEIRIRVRSASVNPVDWKIVAGKLDGLMETYFPAIPGWDVAGEVDAVGPDTPEFQPGDEVIAYARKSFVHDGTFAEFVSVSAEAAARKPQSLSWDEAAGLPLAGLTAYQLLTRLGLKGGDTVLIHAASGGVGLMGSQIALAHGARVIGTASEKNHAFLRELGVEPVAYGDGLAERVRAMAPDGIDVAADFVGGVLDVTRAVLAPNGRHASITDASVQEHGGILVWVRPHGRELQVLADLADAGKLKVFVAERFPLDAVPDAFAASMTGRMRGKIVIQVSR